MSHQRRGPPGDERHRVFVRYVALQLPGWLAGAAALAIATSVLGLPGWVVPAGVAVLVARDLALYPAMRATFRRPAPASPLGARARAVEPLRPAGLVRVGGELWRAETTGAPVPEGAEVVVRAARGLTLLVEPVADAGRLT